MDMLFSRKLLDNPQIAQNASACVKPVAVTSYNILADCHALRVFSEYGEYAWTTEHELKIMYRHTRLLKELIYLNSDIYCLQEVSPSYFHDVLLPAMKGSGYDGVFTKRHDESYDEGEAIIFNKNRFELVTSQGYWLKEYAHKELDKTKLSMEQKSEILRRLESPAVVQIAKLKCKDTDTELTVGSIHVEFSFFKKPDVQCVQIASAIKAVVAFAGGPDKPHIIAGDFNSVPDSPGYQITSEGALSGDCLTQLEDLSELTEDGEKKTSLISLWKEGFQHTSSSLKSSYLTVKGEEPLSSVFPFDSHLRAVDYIWFSSASLDVVRVLETVPPEHIKDGIPNTVAPSDHLSVKALFSFK